MRICMVLHDPQPFGGLEEYAVSLAIALSQRGHDVSLLSTTWVPSDNQYIQRLTNQGVTYVQVPKWLSRIASHWPTKEVVLSGTLRLLTPVIVVLTAARRLVSGGTWPEAWQSARGWLRGQLTRLVGVNYYKPLTLGLLNWWRLRWRPDVLHVQGYTTNLLFVVEWARREDVPTVYEEHQTPDAQFDWWHGFQSSINKATIVVAVSEKSAEGLRNVCGVRRPIVVRNPLLSDPLERGWPADGAATRRDYLQVTTVARLVTAKGLTYLLDAIARVKASQSRVIFKVYGEGPLRHELLQKATRFGIDGEDVFCGPFVSRDELSAIMARTDIFLMSSILEGQPLSVVEAMAYGRPIVATTVGGIPEIIENEVNGLLCPPADGECLALKVLRLIEDRDLRTRLGTEARRAYEASAFQPSSLANHFAGIYRTAVDVHGERRLTSDD